MTTAKETFKRLNRRYYMKKEIKYQRIAQELETITIITAVFILVMIGVVI